MRRALLLLAALVPAAALAAIDYARYAHPRGSYVLEYPANWRRSMGLQAVRLRPPGSAGRQVSVTLERYPLGKLSPATPEAFEAQLRADVGRIKKLDAEGSAEVSGRAARRLALTLTATLKSERGASLPGPRREINIILPKEGGFYYVLKLVGVGAAFDDAVPEFERIASRLTLSEPPPPKPAPTPSR